MLYDDRWPWHLVYIHNWPLSRIKIVFYRKAKRYKRLTSYISLRKYNLKFQRDNSFEILSVISKTFSRSINSFWIFQIFCLFHRLFFYHLFTKFRAQRKSPLIYIHYILYTLWFCYAMYYVVSEIYISRRFFKHGCYSQQIIPGV